MRMKNRGSRSALRLIQVMGLITVALILNACSSLQPTPVSQSRPSSVPASAQLKLDLCPTRVSNPPNLKAHKRSNIACYRGVEVYVAPAPQACLSSGFGKRSGRPHKGIDYQSKPAGPVIAAGNGKIIQVGFRKKDYGNWVVIDHGSGLYTSYAHLKNIANGITIGSRVKRGQRLGIMGNTGKAARAIHLHYEMRTGKYENPKRWWGLKAVDPFSLPDRCS